MVALIKPFGTAAIHLATPLTVALLFGFCLLAARAATGSTDDSTGSGSTRPRAAGFAGVAAIAIATATPSIFDTLGWFNAVAIYLTGVAAATGTVAWMARLATRRQPPSPAHIAASFAVGLVAAGFTELIGMVIALGALMAAANARKACTRGLVGAYVAVAAGATTGVLIILYGPGSRSRFRFQHGGFDLTRILAAIHANLAWIDTFRWDALAAAAAGLLLFALRPAALGPRSARWLLLWCVFLITVPLLVVDLSTAYAGQTVAAPRTAYVAIVFIAAGVATFAYLLAAAAAAEHPRITRFIRPAAAVIFLLSVAGFASAAIPVIQAEQLRQSALSARARSIHRQLAEHRHTVTLTPAPLAILDTSAFDLTFHHRGQYIYVVAGIRQYYDIPAHVALRISPIQPRSYCLNGVIVPWAGVESCEQLAAGEAA